MALLDLPFDAPTPLGLSLVEQADDIISGKI